MLPSILVLALQDFLTKDKEDKERNNDNLTGTGHSTWRSYSGRYSGSKTQSLQF